MIVHYSPQLKLKKWMQCRYTAAAGFCEQAPISRDNQKYGWSPIICGKPVSTRAYQLFTV